MGAKKVKVEAITNIDFGMGNQVIAGMKFEMENLEEAENLAKIGAIKFTQKRKQDKVDEAKADAEVTDNPIIPKKNQTEASELNE